MTQDRPAPPPPTVTPPPYPAYGQPRPSRRPAWFWIAIIGGCFAVVIPILILIALALPQMLKVKKNANESAATMTMRTIQSAEASYVATYPAEGYACQLSLLGGNPGSGAPTAQAAQLIEPALAASGYKNGYIFTITCGARTTINNQDVSLSYKLTAVPKEVGKTGDDGYCSDEKNFIRFDPAGGTHCH